MFFRFATTKKMKERKKMYEYLGFTGTLFEFKGFWHIEAIDEADQVIVSHAHSKAAVIELFHSQVDELKEYQYESKQ